MKESFESINLDQLTDTGMELGINVLLAIMVLIVGVWLANRVEALVNRLSRSNTHLDETLFQFLGNLSRYIVLAFVVVAVLNRFGVETTSIVAMFGAATLAIGLALQGTMSNLAAGVMLMIFRPYKTGDFIDAAGRFGLVEEISLFTTALKTFDNQHIILPNGNVWGSEIINHSHHPVRGVDMRFGVAYGEDLDVVRAVIMSVLERHEHVLDDPAPFVEVETLNDSSVDFIVRPFCKGANYFSVLYSIPEKIKKALDEAEIEIPFPHRKVILYKGDE